MKKEIVEISGLNIPVYTLHTLVVGSGAASLNCADHLYSFGIKDIAVVTEKFGNGASNLSGSDKQTYYKMSVSGDSTDSPYEMARTYFNGFCMHGDIALIEATLSIQEFYHLYSIGVEFPHNTYGGFTGYKTDHDPRQRATSAGPRTSHQMVQRLAEQIKAKDIQIMDQIEIISLVSSGTNEKKSVVGAIGIDKNKINENNHGLILFNCKNIIWGVGGPGGIYKTSVYPSEQLGNIGAALEIGAMAQNLTESQYGLASIKYRWNVSGTYMQVIPTIISTDKDGGDVKEFLNDYFPTMGKLATAIFLKGYQWPFDSRKVLNLGSSIVDILVYQESVMKNRRVYMDFRKNPSGYGKLNDFKFEDLETEAYDYLKNSHALFGTPIERLEKMNPLAITLYKEQNIDITKEPLEIAVCAQHNNGGLIGDIWWQSNVKNLFPIGEVNGSHGVYRPGGSALNSGQVGGYRAAEYISTKCKDEPLDVKIFLEKANSKITKIANDCNALISMIEPLSDFCDKTRDEIQTRMTVSGSHIREIDSVNKALKEAYELKDKIEKDKKIKSKLDLVKIYQNENLCFAHIAYLECIKAYLEKGGGSRGSYLVMDPKGENIYDKLDSYWKFKPENPDLRNKILVIIYKDDKFVTDWISVNKIPEDNYWYENVWRDYREKKIFD
jgi:succinate dehydrogenase/fumarate reductase flavoprotein subunit